MKRLSIFLLLLISLSSCISIKSDYPKIEYYRLSQEPSLITSNVVFEGLLQVRDITVTEDIDTDQFIALWDNTKLQRYFYHRWISDVPSLMTDFIVSRYGKREMFTKGISTSSSLIPPDYLLDIRVLEMMAFNSESKEPNSNKVKLSVQLSFFKRNASEALPKLITKEVFTSEQNRANSTAKTIPIAFSKAFSEISDRIIVAMQNAIQKED